MAYQVENQSSTGKEVMPDLSSSITRRKTIKAAITRIKNFVSTFESEEAEALETRLVKLQQKEREFEEVQTFIEIYSEGQDTANEAYREEVEETIYSTESRIKFLLNKMNKNRLSADDNRSTISVQSPILQLPKISLNTFSGEIRDWNTFHSIFYSLVHTNDSLSDTQKLHYLVTCLKPPVSDLISTLPLIGENYLVAYNTLTARFSNSRLLAAHYFGEVQNFQSIDKKQASREGLQHFLSAHMNSFNAMKQMKNVNMEDFLKFSLALNNLDQQTRTAFENQLSTDEFPTVEKLMSFVTECVRSLEIRAMAVKDSSTVSTSPASKPTHHPRNLILNRQTGGHARSPNLHSGAIVQCLLCLKDDHSIGSCTGFIQLSVSERYDTVRKHSLCYRCLEKHRRVDCTSNEKCSTCNSTRHHVMLHYESSDHSNENKRVLLNSSSRGMLLATALVNVEDQFCKNVTLRAVIDSGSEISTITETAAHRLQLKITKTRTTILGFGSNASDTAGYVKLHISSKYDTTFHLVIPAFVVEKITDNLPSTDIPKLPTDHIANTAPADNTYHKSQPVDLLLGCGVYASILPKHSTVVPGQPLAMYTRLGWILLGEVDSTGEGPRRSLITSVDRIGDVLQKFWESEEITGKQKYENPEDVLCEQNYVATTTRMEDGRYEVALPFRDEVRPGVNAPNTYRKYLNLEKRLAQNQPLRSKYVLFMDEYEHLQHMARAESPSNYVIPHHCILQKNEKLRVVFNASDPDANGITLNDCLLQGPKLQKDLPTIILNSRLHNILVCTDIRMMFRQILVRPQDRRYQSILYRKDPTEPLLEYNLNTVTYGLNCSPYLSQRTILQLVQDEGKEFPEAAEILSHNIYVDDIIFGCDHTDEAETIINQLILLLQRGGFELRKWSSNKAEVLSAFPVEHLENPHIFEDDNASVKILGLKWLPSNDSFTYSIVPFEGIPTKRTILSYLARTYDAIGLVAPVTLWIKAFLQKIWLAKLTWDSTLPQPLLEEWEKFARTLPVLTEVSIPRKISEKSAIIHLLGFCDASETAYAACIYLHSTYENGDTSLHLLTSKSKVSPLSLETPPSDLTIPRLELLAALLLARLVHSVTTALDALQSCKIHLFSDAKTVLTWLATPVHRLKIYVANRVSKILELTSLEMWNHIPTTSNPSDIASRGCSGEFLINSELWWNGPKEFQTPCQEWPISTPFTPLDVIPELKPNVLTVSVSSNDLLDNVEKFSTYRRTINVVAYVLRFVDRCRKLSSFDTRQALSPDELDKATQLCVRLTQQRHFQDPKSLQTSHVRSLAVFLDESGLYRVGGRLRHGSGTFDSRHPMLLPKKCHLTELICDHFHKEAFHAGPRTTQSLIRSKFWIISLRSVLRLRLNKCIKCHRFSGKPIQPIMADLPMHRINESSPFSHVGIDYAGPFMTKDSHLRKPRTYKGYLCLFICMSTRAIHLEYVSDMSTACFLASFDRFVSRRGLPSDCYSDNGTNFVGAARELRQVYEMLSKSQDEISSALANKHIQWHFNPPSGPNFGGLWEAGVKSTKTLLKKTIGESVFTFEQYATLFARIEAILNSRPLLEASPSVYEEINPLTIGHFLIGRSLLAPPELSIDSPSLHCKWKRLKHMSQQFWKLWSRDYVHTQVQRNKWKRNEEELVVGQLVYILGQNTSPLDWPLGRVEKLLPGKDGVARVAMIKSATGILTRPVNKLVPLPLDYPSA